MPFARSISKPRGLSTFWPRSVPTWKPTAGGSRPTVRTPGCMVGGVEAGPAEATAAGARATAVAAASRTFTCPSYVCANDLRRMYRLVLPGSRPNPRAPRPGGLLQDTELREVYV